LGAITKHIQTKKVSEQTFLYQIKRCFGILFGLSAQVNMAFIFEINTVLPIWMRIIRKCCNWPIYGHMWIWFADGQNHEILKPAISRFYIRFHPIYRPCFYFIWKLMTPFYWQQKLPDNREYIKIQEWLLKRSYVQRNI
jgi:hypothetical protein